MFKIEVIGNLGADAKVQSYNGSEFISFSVAHTEKRGEKDEAVWISCTSQQKNLLQYLLKGTKVFVRGSGSIKTYKNDQGMTMAALNLYASEVVLLGSKNDNAAQQAANTQQPANNDLPQFNDNEDAPF